MYDLSALNPMSGMSSVLARDALKGSQSDMSADQQFAKMFVTEVLKQSFAKISSLGKVDNNKSLFPSYDNTALSDLMVEQMSEELLDSGAFKIDQLMPKKNTAQWKNIVSQAKQEWLR